MIDDPDGIVALLADTPLAGLPVTLGPDGSLVITGVSPGQVLPAWRVARSLMPRTGRRPVFRADDWERDDLADPFEPVDLDDVLTPEPNPISPEDLEYYLPEFVATTGELPDQPWTEQTLHRWVYDRVRADPALLAEAERQADHLVGTDYWYQPETVELCLLPTESPHLIAARLDFFGTSGEPEILAAVLEHWHHEWGAELVAEWGTMLQLVVERRPAPGDEAWELAGEHKAFATHQDADQWALALALARSETWFLHSRP